MSEEREYKRFTVSLPESLYNEFEKFRDKLGMSRSDAIRKAMHGYMASENNISAVSGDVVGCITMIMSHEHLKDEGEISDHEHYHDDETEEHIHDFSSRPIYANVHQTDLLLNNDIQHHFNDVIITTMHIHIEYEKCVEIIAVSGNYERIKELKDNLERLKSVLSLGFFIIHKEIEK